MIRTLGTLALTCLVAYGTGCSHAADDQKALDKIRTDAYASHPNDVVGGAKAVNAAVEQYAADLASNTDPHEVAALGFLGYYTKNTYGASEVCSNAGVSIKEFPKAFIAANSIPMAAAAKLVDVPGSIEKAKPAALANSKSELERLAQARQTDLKGVCAFLEANAAAIAEGSQFAKILPNVYAQLVESPQGPATR